MSFVYKQAKTKPCICTWLYIPRNSERIYKHDNSNYLDRQKKHLLNDSYKKKKKKKIAVFPMILESRKLGES